MTPSIHTYSAVVVHRDPDLERKLAATGIMASERMAVAHSSWRLALDRARRAQFFFVESEGRVLNAAKILDVETTTARDVEEQPLAEGRIRFICSHHVPDFVDALIGSEVDDALLVRNPALYAQVVHDVETGAVRLEPPKVRDR